MIQFKHENDKEMITTLHLSLLAIFFDFANYAKERHNWDVVVTDTKSTPEEDKKLGRVSDSHQLGISIDFRTIGVDEYVIDDCVDYIESNPKYEKYKYMSFSGVRRLVLLHNNGNGRHGHMQIHKSFATKKITGC